MNYSNIILVAYRDRPPSLKQFLLSLDYIPDNTELHIINLGSVGLFKHLTKIITGDKQHFQDGTSIIREPNITIHDIPYSGKFWKSKALNYGIANTSSDYITVLDVDAIFPRNFLKMLNTELGNHQKMSYGLRFSDAYSASDTTEGKLTGCSQFTMKREDIESIGCFNEEFIGWGNEDLEFNMRAWNAFGDTWISPWILDHNKHEYSSDWHTKADEDRNTELYERMKAAGFQAPENPEFGDFIRFYDPELMQKYKVEQEKEEQIAKRVLMAEQQLLINAMPLEEKEEWLKWQKEQENWLVDHEKMMEIERNRPLSAKDFMDDFNEDIT